MMIFVLPPILQHFEWIE